MQSRTLEPPPRHLRANRSAAAFYDSCMFILIASFAGLFSGCTPPPPDHARPLSDLHHDFLRWGAEWRSAWRTDGPLLDVGILPEAAFLRLGMLDGGVGAVTARVCVGDEVAATLTTERTDQWHDWRLPLDGAGFAGRPCRIWFDGDRPVWVGPCVLGAKPVTRPNVLIVLIDTLRQDHVGCYGYERATSPNLDALACDGIRFSGLTPPASWTRPSVATLMTGVFPNTHGAQDRVDKRRPGLPTLAARLRAAGYETQGFVTNLHCLPLWNMGTEFGRYVNVRSEEWQVSEKDETAVTAVLSAMETASEPWFFYVHLMSPHSPYTPPASYAAQFAHVQAAGGAEAQKHQTAVDLYDAEIAYADAQIGRLWAALKQSGRYDDTLIVALSDHGEEFWEHGGVDHGKTLFEEQLRVPFIMKLPGGAHAGETRDGLIEMADVTPTMLDMLGVPAAPTFEGRSFRSLLESGGGSPDRIAFAELHLDGAAMRAVKTDALKYIEDRRADVLSWYDLALDPGERAPLAVAPAEGSALFSHLRRMAVQGAFGLHVLVTAGEEGAGPVELNVMSPVCDDFVAFYPEEVTETVHEGSTLRVRFRMGEKKNFFPDSAEWHAQFRPDAAHLLVRLPPDAEVRLNVLADGKPVAGNSLFYGGKMQPGAPPDALLPLLSLAAAPEIFDPALLPRRFAVYVWYTPPPDMVPDASLDAASIEALRGLGYLE